MILCFKMPISQVRSLAFPANLSLALNAARKVLGQHSGPLPGCADALRQSGKDNPVKIYPLLRVGCLVSFFFRLFNHECQSSLRILIYHFWVNPATELFKELLLI